MQFAKTASEEVDMITKGKDQEEVNNPVEVQIFLIIDKITYIQSWAEVFRQNLK